MQLLLLPRLMSAIGEARSCAAGLVVLAAALASSARVRTLPLHALLFLAARAGLAVAETANVALTARHSRPAERGRRLLSRPAPLPCNPRPPALPPSPPCPRRRCLPRPRAPAPPPTRLAPAPAPHPM